MVFKAFFTSGFFLLFLLQTGAIAKNGANRYKSLSPADTISTKTEVIQPVYYTVRLSTEKPLIDGVLDDACWETGEWAGDFTQFVPVEGGKPSQPTELKILYDDKNVYVAIRAYDSEPDKIQRRAGLRDEFIGDIVGVTFDSYHDHRTGFEFDLTASGQKIDLVLTNPMLWDGSWNPVWTGKVAMEDSAWTAEMEIPLSQLRYSGEEDQVWGMHCWRWIDRIQEESDWELQSFTGPGVLYNFGELRGIKGLQKSNRLEIMPYALGKLQTFPKQPENPYANEGKAWGGAVGLDAKIGLTSNFTLDLTINPDFGQVESDPSVMNLTAFEVFYEEKRPFFLEGKSIFNYEFDNLNIFYSRRIGHAPSYHVQSTDSLFTESPEQTTILSAMKISGKTANGLSVGILQSLTAAESAKMTYEGGEEFHQGVEPLTNFIVARVQQDYNDGTTMFGGIFTSTNRFNDDSNLDFLSSNAYTGGLDLLHQWNNKKYFIDARLLGSHVLGSTESITTLQESSARYYQRPGAEYLHYDTTRTTLSGLGGRARIGKGTGLWRYYTGASWITPGMELNDIGYMQSADAIRQENEISNFVNRPVSIFRTYTITLEEFNEWNFNGSYIGSGTHLALSFTFLNRWNLQTNLIYHTQTLDTRILRGGYDMLIPHNLLSFGQISTDASKKVVFGIQYDVASAGQNSANAFQVGPQITVRPINTLRIGLTASYAENYNQLQYVTTEEVPDDSRYILGAIDQQTFSVTFRMDYSITPEFSIQYYGSPFISKGVYSEYKYVHDPQSDEYQDRFTIYQDPIKDNGLIWLDENRADIPPYAIADPDFNFYQFRSNLVLKWEYRPGSLFYLVWSSDRTGSAEPVSSSMNESFNQLWDAYPNNIFLAKFSYWFSL